MGAKCIIFSVALYACLTMGLHIRLYTHNIRYNATSLFPNERPWSERSPILIRELIYNSQHPETLIMLQEALVNQLGDVMSGLKNKTGNEWAYYGVGRDDGETAGEYSPIIYRPDVWQLEASNTSWFCPPDRPLPQNRCCWGAKVPRILTIVRFKHRASEQLLVAMNTHLDNDSSLSRNNSVGIIKEKIVEWAQSDSPDGCPVLLGGDFNSSPSMDAYTLMTNTSSPMHDLKTLVDASKRYGFEYSYTGFNYTMKTSEEPVKGTEVNPPQLIDFLFLGPKGRNYWNVHSYACLPNVFDNGVYMSDHRAVVGDVELLSGPSHLAMVGVEAQVPLS